MATIKKMSKTGSYTVDVVIIVISVIVICFVLFMSVKQYNRLTTVQAEIDNQEMTLMKNKAILQTLQDLSSDKMTLEDAFSLSELYMPANLDESKIIDTLTEYIGQTDGRLTQIRFDKYKKLSGFQRETYCIPFSVLFTGDFTGLMDFLDLLNTGERLFIVKRISILKQDILDAADIKVEIKAECFYQIKKSA